MKLIFLLLGLFVAGSLQGPIDKEWEAFKAKYNKKYDSAAEEEFRKKIFIENKLKIDKHNQAYDEGLVTWKMGINQFSDWTDSEIKSIMLPNKNTWVLGRKY